MRDETIIVRLEVQALGHVLTTAFAKHADEVSEQVNVAVQNMVNNFDFGAEVRRQAKPVLERAIREALERHFSYGGAGKQIIEDALLASLQGASP